VIGPASFPFLFHYSRLSFLTGSYKSVGTQPFCIVFCFYRPPEPSRPPPVSHKIGGGSLNRRKLVGVRDSSDSLDCAGTHHRGFSTAQHHLSFFLVVVCHLVRASQQAQERRRDLRPRTPKLDSSHSGRQSPTFGATGTDSRNHCSSLTFHGYTFACSRTIVALSLRGSYQSLTYVPPGKTGPGAPESSNVHLISRPTLIVL
jgi:hypothetical protein